MTESIATSRVRYIKLGEGGSWADECIATGTLCIGFYTEKFFDLCLAHKWSELGAAYLSEGLSQSTATRFTGEVQIVFEDPGTILWITFHNLRMYWARIDPALPPRKIEGGTVRITQSGWSSRTLHGDELFLVDLAGSLTKTAGYRGTSCDITDADYVVRRINGVERPEVADARRLVGELSDVAIRMMRLLTPKDFELLVELLFSASGWRRLGATGKT